MSLFSTPFGFVDGGAVGRFATRRGSHRSLLREQQRIPTVRERSPELGRAGGVAPYALDAANAELLWETASSLLDL